MQKLIGQLKDNGILPKQFAVAEEPIFQLVENMGEAKETAAVELRSLRTLWIKFAEALGRKGLQINATSLGEMNPKQLYETTMDPERLSSLLKVDIADAALADSIFSMLMGEDNFPLPSLYRGQH